MSAVSGEKNGLCGDVLKIFNKHGFSYLNQTPAISRLLSNAPFADTVF
jgi:hypothetical protein